MIKLEVDHNKHSIGSGGKLQIKKNKSKDNKITENQPSNLQEEKSIKEKDKKEKKEKDNKNDLKEDDNNKKNKKDKKDKKDKKQDKKDQQQVSPQKEKNKKQSKDKKDKKKQKQDKKEGKKKNKQKEINAEKSIDKSKSSSIVKKENTKQEDTIKSIHKSQEMTKLTISQLIQQYKDAAEKLLFNNHGFDPDKQKQIQKQLSKLNRQKQKRHSKLLELQKHRQQIYNSKVKQKQIKKELRTQKQRQKKIERIEQKLKSIEQTSDSRKKDYIKFLQYVNERKKFVPRFKRYEDQDKKNMQEDDYDYKNKIQQIDKVYEPMNLEDINNFQEKYMNQKIQSQHYRQNKIRLEKEMIKHENKQIQTKLWRGRCHQNVRLEIENRLLKKQQNKQREQNRKQFGKSIILQLRKQIEENNTQKNNDTTNNDEYNSETSKVQTLHVRQKFIQGVNYGLIAQEKTTPLTYESKMKLGNQYLSQIKELNKSRKNKTVDYTTSGSNIISDSQQLKERSKTFKLRKKYNPYYLPESNRKSLDFNNLESIQYNLDKIEQATKQKQLQDQIIKHGQYSSVLQIQERKRHAVSLAVKQINQKLDVLDKL